MYVTLTLPLLECPGHLCFGPEGAEERKVVGVVFSYKTDPVHSVLVTKNLLFQDD